MAPPRDTAGSAGTHQQPQQADAPPGRHNQKSPFRNGTTEEGWFYPTPAAVKAAADVRGARGAVMKLVSRPGSESPRAGNAEAYYPHFQFDSNYTYGMVHRE